MKQPVSRRRFMNRSALFGSVLILPNSRVFGANERVQVGVIGCGGRGTGHVSWAMQSGAQVVAVCDPDEAKRRNAAKKAGGEVVKKYGDMRELFDDKDVDATIIATPNHWHALATIWACQAGKDVYVEKPASHSIWEGRKMVEAARKYKCMVQIGTQQRSDPALIQMRDMLDKKELGELQWVHSMWYAHRGSIGKTTEPQKVPDGVDYDLWCGPREKVPLMRKRFHYDWHWFWDYGNGDMGNRVIHVIDDIHHVLRIDKDVPTRMMAVGGRFKYNDDANTPNTEVIIMDWKVPIIFGSRNMPYIDPKSGKGTGTSLYRRFGKGLRFTNLIKCEKGFFTVTRGGGKVYDNDGNTIKQLKGDGGGSHMKNYFDAVKSRDHKSLKADVEQGHLGCLLLHTGNNSYRVGQAADPAKVAEACNSSEEAKLTWESTAEHLKSNGVDLNIEKPTLGPWLTFDPKTERFTGEHAEAANALVKESYRAPYVIPDQV